MRPIARNDPPDVPFVTDDDEIYFPYREMLLTGEAGMPRPREKAAMNSSSKDQRSGTTRGGNVPTQADLEALASFRLALRQFLATADVELERHGLGPRRYQAMLAIQAHRTDTPISVGELAGLLLIRHNTAAELVKRLDQAGLVRKWYDTADRRRVLLALTGDGQSKLGEIATAQLQRLHGSRAAMLAIFGLTTPGDDGKY